MSDSSTNSPTAGLVEGMRNGAKPGNPVSGVARGIEDELRKQPQGGPAAQPRGVVDGLVNGMRSGANQGNRNGPPSTKPGNAVDGIVRGLENGVNKDRNGTAATKPGNVAEGVARGMGDALKPNGPDPSEPNPSDPSKDVFADRLAAVLKKLQGNGHTSESAAKSTVRPAAPPKEHALRSEGPVGTGEHVVQQGECISSIARETGHFWKTIWNDAANAALRQARVDPNVLLPGDRVHVPPLREKWSPAQTEMRHRYRRRGEPTIVRLTLQVDDVPLGNQPYTLEIDGQMLEGFTDAEGKLQQSIPASARNAKLIVGEERWEYQLQLGHTDPVDNLAGVQKRLINLGFDCGQTSGSWDDASREAMRDFQRSVGLAETGDPDELSRQTLKQVHGS